MSDLRTQIRDRNRVAEPAAAAAAPTVTDGECAVVHALYESRALKSFLRGQHITQEQAEAFWITGGGRNTTGDLLRRALEAVDVEPRPRLPSLSSCYGLLNLHRLLCDRWPVQPETVESIATPSGEKGAA